MIGFRKALADYKGKKFNVKVELGDDSTYTIKGVGSASFQLDSGTITHIEEILYVPGLNKNILSMAILQYKKFCALFSKGKDLVWLKDGNMRSTIVIGVCEGDLYKVSTFKRCY